MQWRVEGSLAELSPGMLNIITMVTISQDSLAGPGIFFRGQTTGPGRGQFDSITSISSWITRCCAAKSFRHVDTSLSPRTTV